jgi:hypothetical protein
MVDSLFILSILFFLCNRSRPTSKHRISSNQTIWGYIWDIDIYWLSPCNIWRDIQPPSEVWLFLSIFKTSSTMHARKGIACFLFQTFDSLQFYWAVPNDLLFPIRWRPCRSIVCCMLPSICHRLFEVNLLLAVYRVLLTGYTGHAPCFLVSMFHASSHRAHALLRSVCWHQISQETFPDIAWIFSIQRLTQSFWRQYESRYSKSRSWETFFAIIAVLPAVMVLIQTMFWKRRNGLGDFIRIWEMYNNPSRRSSFFGPSYSWSNTRHMQPRYSAACWCMLLSSYISLYILLCFLLRRFRTAG